VQRHLERDIVRGDLHVETELDIEVSANRDCRWKVQPMQQYAVSEEHKHTSSLPVFLILSLVSWRTCCVSKLILRSASMLRSAANTAAAAANKKQTILISLKSVRLDKATRSAWIVPQVTQYNG
jgi:hypothetical protein